jgi:hypothetical protein
MQVFIWRCKQTLGWGVILIYPCWHATVVGAGIHCLAEENFVWFISCFLIIR